jgi:hypothetical protein
MQHHGGTAAGGTLSLRGRVAAHSDTTIATMTGTKAISSKIATISQARS